MRSWRARNLNRSATTIQNRGVTDIALSRMSTRRQGPRTQNVHHKPVQRPLIEDMFPISAVQQRPRDRKSSALHLEEFLERTTPSATTKASVRRRPSHMRAGIGPGSRTLLTSMDSRESQSHLGLGRSMSNSKNDQRARLPDLNVLLPGPRLLLPDLKVLRSQGLEVRNKTVFQALLRSHLETIMQRWGSLHQ